MNCREVCPAVLPMVICNKIYLNSWEGRNEALSVLTGLKQRSNRATGRREGSISLIAIRALLEPPNRSTVRLIEPPY